MRLRALATGLATIVFATSVEAASKPDAGTLAPAAIRERIESQWRRAQNLRVIVRTRDDGPGQPASAHLHLELRVLGGDRFFLDFAHGADGADWTRDYNRNRSFLSADRYVVDWTGMRAHEGREIAPDAELPLRFAVHPIFAVGYWPPDARRPAPRLMDVCLGLAAVLSDPEYRVEGARTQHCGIPCVVVERPGRDRLLLDETHGFALVRREIRRADTGALVLEIDAGDLQEAAPGIWFPKRITHTNHGALEPGAALAPVVSDVLELELDCVSPADFEFTPPPGAFQISRTSRDWHQSEPGGIEYLERLGDQLRAGVAMPAHPAPGLMAAAIAAAALGAIVAVLSWRHRRGSGVRSGRNAQAAAR